VLAAIVACAEGSLLLGAIGRSACAQTDTLHVSNVPSRAGAYEIAPGPPAGVSYRGR
jgi:hypothetical protein